MNNEASREPIAAASGKVVSEAFVYNQDPDAHGVLLIFADGTEVSIDFDYTTRIAANVRHYSWLDGDAVTIV
jgi:hypothetical protein